VAASVGLSVRSLHSSVCLAGTVLKLGTAVHHEAMLDGIDRLDPTGCFALTELGFGVLLTLRALVSMPSGAHLSIEPEPLECDCISRPPPPHSCAQ
jgi:hypothetical protein